MCRNPGGLRELHLLTGGDGRIHLGLRIGAESLELLAELRELFERPTPQGIDRHDRQGFHPSPEPFQAHELALEPQSCALHSPLRPCKLRDLGACLESDPAGFVDPLRGHVCRSHLGNRDDHQFLVLPSPSPTLGRSRRVDRNADMTPVSVGNAATERIGPGFSSLACEISTGLMSWRTTTTRIPMLVSPNSCSAKV